MIQVCPDQPPPPKLMSSQALAFGDHRLLLGDERTLLSQNRLRSEIAELEWLAKVGTYHVRRRATLPPVAADIG